MFSKKASAKDPAKSAPSAPEVTSAVPDPGAPRDKTKSGPTPRRKDAEAANKVPLVPGDRRAASKAARERNRELRDIQYKALQSGDEKGLPARDRGPVRRYARNYVDARRNLGEYFLLIALVFMVLIMMTAQVKNQTLPFIVTVLLYSMVFVTIFDAWYMWRKLKGKLIAKFGEDKVDKSVRWYAVMRVFQLRRARLPKPQVKHGEYPE